MSDFPLVDVVSVKPLPRHHLLLTFSDGSEGVADLSADFEAGGEMTEPLRDDVEFARVFVEAGVPTWPNGFEVDAIRLYMELLAANGLRRPAAAE